MAQQGQDREALYRTLRFALEGMGEGVIEDMRDSDGKIQLEDVILIGIVGGIQLTQSDCESAERILNLVDEDTRAGMGAAMDQIAAALRDSQR